MDAPGRPARSWRFPLLVSGVLVLLYLPLAAWLVRDGHPNADEGFYLAAAHAVIDEGRVPYRDFGYTQLPWFPYLQGLVLKLAGFDVGRQRWLNAGWLAASLVLLGWLVRRATGDTARAAFAVLLAMLSLGFVYYGVVGKTYALAQGLVLLCAAGLLVRVRLWAAIAWVGVTGALAVGCRLTVAPAVGVLWLGLVWLQARRVRPVFTLAALVVLLVASLAPFYALAPDNFMFWTWEYHLHSSIGGRLGTVLPDFARLAPAFALAGVVAWLRPWRREDLAQAGTWWLAAGTAGVAANLTLAGTYAEYAMPLLGLWLLGAVVCFPPKLAAAPRIRLAAWGLVPLALAGSWFHATGSEATFARPGYVRSARAAAAALARHTAPDALVLASMPEIPVMAHRRIPPGLELGKFAVSYDVPDDVGAPLHLVSYDRLLRFVNEREAAAVVIAPSDNWSFGLSVPRMLYYAKPHAAFLQAVRANYTAVFVDAHFIVFVARTDLPAAPPGAAAPARGGAGR